MMVISNKQKAKWIWRSLKRHLDEGRIDFDMSDSNMNEEELGYKMISEITIQLNVFDQNECQAKTQNED